MLDGITDRLTDLVTRSATPKMKAQVQPALRLACRQLELLNPGVIGATPQHRMVSTLAAGVPRRTWLVLLANRSKIFTIHVKQPPDQSAPDLVGGICDAVAETFKGLPEGPEIIRLIEFAVKRHGAPPGKSGPVVAPAIIMQILGALFGGLPADARTELLGVIDQSIADDICPVFVGLVGKGSSPQTMSGLWPAYLMLGPYVDSLNIG
jgi:hypothetical protein